MSKKETKRVFLVDSMSHIFRAYFAPMGRKQEPLRNSKGQVTQAVFVFTNILRKLLTDENPDYIAAVFDSAAPTFRHDAYAEYKANREDMPEELAAQLPYIERVCEAFNIPILKMDGFEADDIIGTLAVQCKEQELQAVIVSNDKDLCQIVSDPHIICMRQNSQNIKRKEPVPAVEWCDEKWVENKFGLPPDKIIDYLGLMGDSIDNIPGAKGIGAKGAVKLILKYGSAEGAMENAEKVSHKTYRNSLLENQEDIRQSLELATVHTEVPMKLDLDSLKHEEPDRQLAYRLFRELEFSSLTREFADSAPLFDNLDAPLVKINRRYHIVDTREDLDKLIRRLWETENWSFMVDDSNSADKADSYAKKEPLGVAIATAAGFSNYIDLENFKDDKAEAITQLGDILSNGFLSKCTHDYKMNLAVLNKLGIKPESVTDDTMIAAYLLDSSRSKYDLATLAQLNLSTDPLNEIPEGWTENQYRTTENADFAFQLAPRLFKQIEEDNLQEIYEEIEMPLIPVLFEIEMAGLKVDVESLNETSEFLKGEIEEISKKIFELAGREFNINSPKQVGEVLQELNIETRHKTPTGKISTSKDALQEIGETYEIAGQIIEFRELDKIKATYSDVLPTLIDDDNRIHGNLNQTVTTTGRLSSSDPNLQNIPIRTEVGRRIRRAFVPEEGNKLISADYSQLELRILAHITKDEVMLEAFKNNEDIHTKTAKLVFEAKTDEELKEKRRLAKIVNFAIAYAVESYGLSQRVGLSRSEAKDVIEDYYETYKGIKTFMEETPEIAKEQGFVTSILGRRRYLPSIKDRNYNVRSRAEREAINMPIQGCLPYKTKVLTSEGYKQIGELYLEDCEKLQVWTGSCFADFTVLNRGECELAEIHLENGQILRCDTRHKILVVEDSGYKWKEFNDLNSDDKVCLSMPKEIEYGSLPKFDFSFYPKNSKGIQFNITELDEDFFYWLGFYFGDGWIIHNKDEGRWNLAYSFGSIHGKEIIKDRLVRSTDFFNSIGLRTNVRWQSKNKAEMVVYSKGFIEFLSELGVETNANARTKRVPNFVFASPLKYRKMFLKGMLDADGYKGNNGATTPTLHLCQRELLEDLRLLFRTTGVECKIRGPYKYNEFTSYRLDLVGGLLNQAIGFCDINSVKIPNVKAHKFLIDNFLDNVKSQDLDTHSHKVIYSRLKHGGVTSVYTLSEMLKNANKQIDLSIFAWSKIKKTISLGEIDTTYTLSVNNKRHSFDSEGIISKNTASDIVKIAMLKVDKALKREGLKTKVIMQVHDELLLESPNDEVEKVLELVTREMESAVELDVPLTVEIGAGDNWMNVK